MEGNLQIAKTQVENFAVGHSYSASCAYFGVDRDAHGGIGLAEPSTLLPSRVSQEEGV